MSNRALQQESTATTPADMIQKIEERDQNAAILEALVYARIDAALPALKSRTPVDWQEILSLLKTAPAIIESEGMEGFQARLKDDAGNPDTQKIDAFCHLYNVLQTVRSYTSVLMERAHQTETDESFQMLRDAIHEMKAKGYSLEDAAKFFDEVRISKSFTSHPTENLSVEGILLCKDLVAAAEHAEPEKRAENIESVIDKMILCQNFGASKKVGILEEIDASDQLAKIHNEGCNRLERYVAKILKEAYGTDPQEPICLDIAPRSWDYDSDGKNNAEGWAMLVKMSGTTLRAMEHVQLCLDKASEKEPSLDPDQNFTKLRKALEEISKEIQIIYNRSREVTQNLALIKDSLEREEKYKKIYTELQNVTKDFGEIYDSVDAEKRGFHFYMNTLDVLHAMRTQIQESNPSAALDIDEAYRNLQRNGFVLEKGQTRQNDVIHTKIIDNLFNWIPFRERGALEAGELADIDSKSGFSRLSTEHQSGLLEKITQYCQNNGNRKQVLEDLFSANPLTFDKDGNGFPRQERTLLDRFRLRALYPLKFDQGIISDCGDLGPARQMFIADIFGMHKMRHMPLFEGRSTLSIQPKLLELFQRTGGKKGVDRRRELTMRDPLWNGYLRGRDVHDISTMFPCSDGEKLAGSATRLETFSSIHTDIRESYERRIALEIMLGGGLSMGRFGGDPGIIRRVAEQELKAIAVKREQPFRRSDKLDRRMMRSALAVLYTEQGRATRYYTCTPAQVADNFAKRITEMVYGRFDLEGLVAADYSYIQKLPAMSPSMQKTSIFLRNRAIQDFEILRFAVSDDSDADKAANIITNRLAKIITTPHTIGFMNNGARPGSKSGSKEMTEVRAIENDERHYISRLHLSGYYSAGNLMLGLWEKVNTPSPEITLDDVLTLINNPEWEYNYFIKNVVDAGRADFSYALNKTGWSNATFDDLIDVGQSVKFTKIPEKENYRMEFHTMGGKITPEQAYIAKVFYDRILFISMLEAALNTNLSSGPTLRSSQADLLAAFRPADNSVHVDLGPLTKEKYKASVAIICEHKRNMPGYAIQYMLEEHIAQQIEKGISKDEAIAKLGGESFLRKTCSAYRAGTLPHWLLWTGMVNYCLLKIPIFSLKPKELDTAPTLSPT